MKIKSKIITNGKLYRIRHSWLFFSWLEKDLVHVSAGIGYDSDVERVVFETNSYYEACCRLNSIENRKYGKWTEVDNAN